MADAQVSASAGSTSQGKRRREDSDSESSSTPPPSTGKGSKKLLSTNPFTQKERMRREKLTGNAKKLDNAKRNDTRNLTYYRGGVVESKEFKAASRADQIKMLEDCHRKWLDKRLGEQKHWTAVARELGEPAPTKAQILIQIDEYITRLFNDEGSDWEDEHEAEYYLRQDDLEAFPDIRVPDSDLEETAKNSIKENAGRFVVLQYRIVQLFWKKKILSGLTKLDNLRHVHPEKYWAYLSPQKFKTVCRQLAHVSTDDELMTRWRRIVADGSRYIRPLPQTIPASLLQCESEDPSTRALIARLLIADHKRTHPRGRSQLPVYVESDDKITYTPNLSMMFSGAERAAIKAVLAAHKAGLPAPRLKKLGLTFDTFENDGFSPLPGAGCIWPDRVDIEGWVAGTDGNAAKRALEIVMCAGISPKAYLIKMGMSELTTIKDFEF